MERAHPSPHSSVFGVIAVMYSKTEYRRTKKICVCVYVHACVYHRVSGEFTLPTFEHRVRMSR